MIVKANSSLNSLIGRVVFEVEGVTFLARAHPPSPREKWENRKSPGGGGDRTQAISFRWLLFFFRLSDCSHCFIHILCNSSLENLDDFLCIANLWPLSENEHEIEYKCSLRGGR